MDTNLIKQDWDALAGKRMPFVHGFYQRLFTRHPRYRVMFPDLMDAQMEKMVEIFSSVARFSDHVDLIRPYLVSVGYAHRSLGIGPQDVENFKNVFVETLAEHRADSWDRAHEAAWRQAFDDMVVPMFDEGLDTGNSA